MRSCVARQKPYIPGALSILQGTVPGRVRGSGHMVPTYFRRELRDRALQRRLWLRTFVCCLLPSDSLTPPPSRHTLRKRGVQYAAASRFCRGRLWNTHHPLSRVMTTGRVVAAIVMPHVRSSIEGNPPRRCARGARWLEPRVPRGWRTSYRATRI